MEQDARNLLKNKRRANQEKTHQEEQPILELIERDGKDSHSGPRRRERKMKETQDPP